MKTRLTRKEYDRNSIFEIKAKYVTTVWDTDMLELQYTYNINTEKLIVLSDVETIYVLYE